MNDFSNKPRNQNDIFDDSAPHVKEVERRLRQYFCEGVLVSDGSKLAKIALMNAVGTLLISPVTAFFFKWRQLLIVLCFWLFAQHYLKFIPNVTIIFWSFALLIIFYKDLIDTLADFFKSLAIAVTGGQILKWLCDGYLQGALRGHFTIASKSNAGLITILLTGVNFSYRQKYNELLELYLASSSEEGRTKLEDFLNGEKSFS